MSITAEVKTLGDFLEDFPKLNIPDYQREFKWEPSKVNDLFGDVIEGLALRNQNPKACFLGSLVLSINSTSQTVDLVDGQQRITILTLILRCLADKCVPTSVERIRTLKLLKGKDDRVIHHKKSPNTSCDDYSAYYECAIAATPNLLRYGRNTNKTTASLNADWARGLKNSLIYKAFKTLEASVQSLLVGPINPEAALKQVLDGIQLVVINADESKEAMRVFASINAGGTPLEPWELIKSSFYSHSNSNELKTATYDLFEGPNNSLTKAFSPLTKSEDRDSNKNDVLRTHWVANFGLISKDNLFDAYNDYISDDASRQRLSDLIKGIGRTLSFHQAFNSKVYRHNRIRFDAQFFSPLDILKAKISLPVLAAVAAKYNDSERLSEALKRCAFALEQMHVTWRIMGYAANTLDGHFAAAAVSITNDSTNLIPSEIHSKLVKHLLSHPSMPNHVKLVAHFKTFEIMGEGKFAQLIAHRLNSALGNLGNETLSFNYLDIPLFNKEGFKIEKGFKLEADQCTPNDIRNYGFKDASHLYELGDSLGNLFAIKPGDSRITASLPINKDFDISDLDAARLDSRNRQLSELAAKIWLPNSNI
jgi:hypothetical protein